tara:strand:+ start:167 stop:358 length:192 start_codon:yes stop_codon:yes gene_type:complete
MNKINNLDNPSFTHDLSKDINYEDDDVLKQSNIKHEKILCNHCGRTAMNDIRCLGICVADNDY